MRIAAITVVRDRSAHLSEQALSINRSTPPSVEYVVVAMGDPTVRSTISAVGVPVRVVDIDVPDEQNLPLAAARNAGAAAALADGAQLLVFLDVDCVASDELFARYRRAALAHPDRLLCGPVAYLPAPGAGGYDWSTVPSTAAAHPARPSPPDGQVVAATPAEQRLFWSLSFAVTASTWRRVGGFCELYTGYGGEDTDFAEQARAVGVGLAWVGGAIAYHQHHPVSAPPIEHCAAIVRNAAIFHRRWGWWPMTGWLDAFAERGLAEFATGSGWVVSRHLLPAGRPSPRAGA